MTVLELQLRAVRPMPSRLGHPVLPLEAIERPRSNRVQAQKNVRLRAHRRPHRQQRRLRRQQRRLRFFLCRRRSHSPHRHSNLASRHRRSAMRRRMCSQSHVLASAAFVLAVCRFQSGFVPPLKVCTVNAKIQTSPNSFEVRPEGAVPAG